MTNAVILVRLTHFFHIKLDSLLSNLELFFICVILSKRFLPKNLRYLLRTFHYLFRKFGKVFDAHDIVIVRRLCYTLIAIKVTY